MTSKSLVAMASNRKTCMWQASQKIASTPDCGKFCCSPKLKPANKCITKAGSLSRWGSTKGCGSRIRNYPIGATSTFTEWNTGLIQSATFCRLKNCERSSTKPKSMQSSTPKSPFVFRASRFASVEPRWHRACVVGATSSKNEMRSVSRRFILPATTTSKNHGATASI